MKQITISIATEDDARYVARNLRAADRAEVRALGFTPEQAVEVSRRESDTAWVARVNGTPAMVFGVRQALVAEEAEIWALGTDVCTSCPRQMLWYGRRIVEGLSRRYPVMKNYCDARYDAAHRWLRKIGFSVGVPRAVGPKGAMFCEIRITREG